MQDKIASFEARISHRWILLSLFLVALALLAYGLQTELRLTDGQLGVPLDDAWIHFQFARNVSQGNGFSYNPGDPTPGSTAPLWTLLLAGVGFFTHDFLIPSLVLSAAFFLLTVGLTYGFVFELTASRWASWLAALGVCLTGRLLWAGLAGMETTAFAAASLLAVWIYKRQGLRPLTAFLFGLAGQLRPEGHALFALAVTDTFLTAIFEQRQTMGAVFKSVLKAVLVYGLVAAPYAILGLMTTGHPLPNTFYAKVGREHFFSWRTLRETMRLHWLDNPASFILLPLGLVPLWRRSRLAFMWLLGLPLLTAVIVDFVWHHGRYTMPLIPFQMIAAALGAHWLFGKVTGRYLAIRPLSSQLGMLSLLIVAFVVGGGWRVPQWARMLGSNSREILEIDVALGQWLAENTPPDALIAVDDIGAITYLSQRRIVDMNGLVSPEMWPALRQPMGLPRNQVAARILSAADPAYLVGFPLWHWEITTNTAVTRPIHRVRTASRTIIAEQEAVVYRATWPYLTGDVIPQVAVNAVWGDAIQLLGYDLSSLDLAASLPLTLYWHSLAPVGDSYDVFIHLTNSAGEIVAQADQKPVQGLAATNVWQPDDTIRDSYQLALPPDLPAGAYKLNAGLYLRETGERLLVEGSEDSVSDIFTLTTVVWGGD